MVAVACVAAYAGQLGMGRWQTDEYRLFTMQRAWGWEAFVPFLAYLPRPFSNGLLFLYGEAVLRFGRPLITPFLALLWGGVLGAGTLAARGALSRSGERTLAAPALAATLFAFVLVTNPATEFFFWPMAAAAYLPVAGAATALLFLLSRPLDRGRRLACGAALLVAATSSEVGAALAISFAGAAAIEAASRPGRLFPGPHGFLPAALREGTWWIVPGLIGVGVMAMVLSVRAGIVELGADAQPYTGHPVASVGAALLRLASELAAADGADGTSAASAVALAARPLFALGFALVWRRAGGAAPGRLHAVLAVSLIGAAFFSLAAAFFHYGAPCCERQATTRAWLLDLLAVILAGALAARWQPARPGKGRGAAFSAALLTASLFPALQRVDGLRRDYDMYHYALTGRARTWRSGLRADQDAMEFFLPPDGPDLLVRGTALPIGTFRTGSDAPELVTAVGRFFGKDVVNTCQPWQTERSWVINGRFIPACPPNDVPPEVVPARP